MSGRNKKSKVEAEKKPKQRKLRVTNTSTQLRTLVYKTNGGIERVVKFTSSIELYPTKQLEAVLGVLKKKGKIIVKEI